PVGGQPAAGGDVGGGGHEDLPGDAQVDPGRQGGVGVLADPGPPGPPRRGGGEAGRPLRGGGGEGGGRGGGVGGGGGEGLWPAGAVALAAPQPSGGDGEHQVPAGVRAVVGEPAVDLVVGVAGQWFPRVVAGAGAGVHRPGVLARPGAG